MTAKIWAKQAAVCIQYRDQCDIGKVVPLSQHLGAYQDTGCATVDRVIHGLHSIFFARGISVNSQDWRIGKTFLQPGFAALGTISCSDHTIAAAAGAPVQQSPFVVAVVADQTLMTAVHR